ncbi:MAG: hypothetical protein ACI4EE_01635 [Lachnospiraceae bacterium]
MTADYLLNDEYDSDFDVPVVRQIKSDAKDKINKEIALCVGLFGLMGIFDSSFFDFVSVRHGCCFCT